MSEPGRVATEPWRRKNNMEDYQFYTPANKRKGNWYCRKCGVNIAGEHEMTCPVGGREHNMLVREKKQEPTDADAPSGDVIE